MSSQPATQLTAFFVIESVTQAVLCMNSEDCQGAIDAVDKASELLQGLADQIKADANAKSKEV